MFLRLILVIILLVVAYVANAFVNPFPDRESQSQSNKRPLYGFTYSFEQAGWYGLSPRESYIKLLDEVKFDWVRLPFFWNQMINENGELKIEDLEFATQEAQKRNIGVIIALGTRTPYYPEYKWPNEVASKVKFGDTIDINHPAAADILQIDRKLVEQLSGYDNITYWQIENEPFLAAINNWKIDTSLLEAEVKVVREADPGGRPIILNHVGPATLDKRYKKLLELLTPGDILGVNAYFKTQGVDILAFKIFGREVHIEWPRWLVFPNHSWLFLSPDYDQLKRETQAKGVDLWILEVQAEPYIRKVEEARADEFFYTAQDLIKADKFMKSWDVESIGLWGVHFWQYRQSLGDNSWVEAVKSVVNN